MSLNEFLSNKKKNFAMFLRSVIPTDRLVLVEAELTQLEQCMPLLFRQWWVQNVANRPLERVVEEMITKFKLPTEIVTEENKTKLQRYCTMFNECCSL